MNRLTLVLAFALASEAAAQGVLVERLSWDEARPLLTADAVVLVAVGAQAKEHGRHLPLNNDWLMAEYLKGRVVAATSVVAYPTINYHWPHVGESGERAATGVYGDPTLATRDKGETIVEAMVKGILQEIDALRQASVPTP